MKKEWLLMTMVTADKEITLDNEIIRAYPIDIKADENIWVHPDRLVDPDDLDYGYPKAEDMFFSVADGEWKKASDDFNEELTERFLIFRKPCDEWQAWEDNCPLTEWSPEMREKLIDWIKKAIEIGKGK